MFNVATGEGISVNGLADAIGRVLGRTVEREYLPERPGDVRDSWADISAAQETLGWQPTVGLDEGLERSVESLLASQ